MAKDVTDIEGLARELADGLKEYNQEIADGIKEAIDDTAKEAVEAIKADAPRKTGKYAAGWTKKKAWESQSSKRNTVYNKDRYQLTHLLEHGHASRSGGRVRAIPHIGPVEESIKTELEDRIEKVVKEAT